MSYEIVAVAPLGGENGVTPTYSYDPLDDGADCEHEGRLTYGRILRKEINGKSLCVDARRISPRRPDSHPIIRDKLKEWKEKALAAIDDWVRRRGFIDEQTYVASAVEPSIKSAENITDEQRRKLGEKEKARVRFFSENITHIPHSDFIDALKKCCELFQHMYPDNEFLKISKTSLKSESSDRWVEDIAIEEGFLKIPERSLSTHQTKKKEIREKIYFKVDDGMYTGSQFSDEYEKLQVYICPFIAGGDEWGDGIIGLPSISKKNVVYFICSKNRRVTHKLLWKEGKIIFSAENHVSINDAINEDRQKTVIFIYHSLMEKNGVTVPFYFDHKLADDRSWELTHGMLGGLHLHPDWYVDKFFEEKAGPSTEYIEGCEKSQGNFTNNYLEGFRETCPSRPQWKLEW